MLHSLKCAFQSVPMLGNCRFSSVHGVSHKEIRFSTLLHGLMWAETLLCAWKTASRQPACPPVNMFCPGNVLSGKNGQQPVFNFHGHFSIIFTREGKILTYSTVSNHLALFCVLGSMPMLQQWPCPELLHRGESKF
jgi:hypothetical protein